MTSTTRGGGRVDRDAAAEVRPRVAASPPAREMSMLEQMIMSIENPHMAQFKAQLPMLLQALGGGGGAMAATVTTGVAAMADGADEKYLEVVPQWWGLVFVLSDRATQDLANGATGLAAVAGVIAALCAAIPAAQAAGVVAGVISAMLALHAALITAVNRGNGIYLTALWGVVAVPGMWIPTPR